jgi:serine/threonine protein phosphatase 1
MTLWSFNGGAWFSNLSEKEQHRAYDALRECEQLPYIIELHCASGVNIIAHADYPSDHYAWQKPVDKESVLWRRERLSEHLAGKGSHCRCRPLLVWPYAA